MKRPGSSTKTSIRVVVSPTSVGLGSLVLPGTASCTKNGAPCRWRPATPPRSQSSHAPSAVLYQPTAAAASETINITERNGRSVSFVTGSNSRRHVNVAPVIAREQARRSVRWRFAAMRANALRLLLSLLDRRRVRSRLRVEAAGLAGTPARATRADWTEAFVFGAAEKELVGSCEDGITGGRGAAAWPSRS